MTSTISLGLVIIMFPIIINCWKAVKNLKLNDYYIYDYDYLSKKYKWWRVFTLFILMCITIAISIILPNIISLVSKNAINSSSEVIYLINPDYGFWMLPCVFWGGIVSIVLASSLMKILLGGSYREFYVFLNSPYGMEARNGEYLTIIISIIVGIGVMIFYVFGINWYVKLTNNNIVENTCFGFSQRKYNYKDVKNITTYDKVQYKDSKIEDDYHIVIEFKDGQKWDSLGYGRSNNIDYDKMIANYISQKSDKKIIYKQIDKIK
ncbi:hypothetical protein [Clostridium sp. C8-1-8]|uniref:hypothetical protein n=1 Tax=Clostridium sp. C8-1-8 TaxID=2698831 RepID=UPI00136D58D6|nr:hypothetical protein [Clostridium sp. C8-1-8]